MIGMPTWMISSCRQTCSERLDSQSYCVRCVEGYWLLSIEKADYPPRFAASSE